MATSGVTTWQLTQDSLAQSALRKLEVIGDGVTPSATQMANAVLALNAMLKTFIAKGMPLWATTEYTFSLTATHNYVIGVGQTLNTPAPLKIIQATLINPSDGTGIPLNIYTHYDYNLLTNTGTSGTPIAIEYEPLNQRGTIKLWPKPDASNIATKQVTIVYQRPFEDMVSSTDTLDFPQWWSEPIIYGLAWRLAPEYGIPSSERGQLKQEAQMLLEEALSFGTEEGSFKFQPDWTWSK